MTVETVNEGHGSEAAVSLTIPARPENIAVVRQAIAGLADSMPIDPNLLADVNMAVTEACTNVILHAYPESLDGDIELHVLPADEELTVVVRDSGEGIRPRPMQELGSWRLGLPLIAALADDLEVTKGPRGRGTEVRMSFAL
jgi:anti-sigma regulatory factor (Ser/Thr protein kinase)